MDVQLPNSEYCNKKWNRRRLGSVAGLRVELLCGCHDINLLGVLATEVEIAVTCGVMNG
jgi:hypothetical protein